MRFSAIEKLSRIVNLLFTCASQPPFAANHHVIAQLCHTLNNAFVSVGQIRIPGIMLQNMYVLNMVTCIMVTACWVKHSTW